MRDHPQSADVIKRLARIEGHVRGIKQMAEDGKPCSDILLQIAAVQAALRKVGQAVLEDHLDHCILGARPEDSGKLLAELKEALSHYGR
ncbi:MAG: metal-sensing transcriptional repressor [Bacillota bacterium]